MSSIDTIEPSCIGLHPKQWYNLACIVGVMIVLAVVSMHAVPVGMLSPGTHALTTQTTRPPFSYAEFPGQLPSRDQLHGKSDGLSSPTTYWKVAFPRSGSTSLDILLDNCSEAATGGPVFTSSDCEIGDIARSFHNCGEEMHAIVQCEFSKYTLNALWGEQWDAFIPNGPSEQSCCNEPYSPAVAHKRCSEAAVRSFGTLEETTLDDAIPNLKSISTLLVVNQVRDPRGMYQSLKKLIVGMMAANWYGWEPTKFDRGFAGQEGLQLNMLTSFATDNPGHVRRLCGALAKMKNASHPRLFQVRFEDLISSKNVAKNIISFIGFPWRTDFDPIHKTVFPGLKPGYTWAHINHYPGKPGYTWSKRELKALYDVKCQHAIAIWDYPLTLAQ